MQQCDYFSLGHVNRGEIYHTGALWSSLYLYNMELVTSSHPPIPNILLFQTSS